jgi:iron complex outermembrane recepter protein
MCNSHCRHQQFSRRFSASGSWLAVLLSPGSAFCQESATTPPGVTALEEVLVTARLISEDVHRVPLSVQAVSGEFLERRNLSNLYDLQYAVPGLVLNNRGMFGAGISLRGVSDEGGGGLSVAPHFNGVYLGSSTLALARQFDVERVEVVKGPQGTLYGKNATGGSLNVLSRRPEPEFAAGAQGSFGSFDTVRANGFVNIGGDRVAARVAFAGADGDGFIRNSIDDRRFAEDDFWAVRASVRAQPAEALTIDAMLQRVDDDGASGDLWGPRRDQLVDPDDIRLTTVRLANPYHETTNDFASVNVAYEFGGMTLRSITGYARNLTRNLDDCAGVPALAGCVRGVAPLRYEQYSQEFRLESQSVDRLDWIVGAHYVASDEDQRFSLRLTAPNTPIQNYTQRSDEKAYALFGDSTLELAGQWRLNGGVRFTREEARLRFSGNGVGDPAGPRDASGTWNSTSWRLGADFSPNEKLFFYANVSTGFKSGGVTNQILPGGQYDNYDPEKNTAYEVGMSAKTWNGRSTLRASAFTYDFEDMQVTTTSIIDGIPRTVIDNAAKARIAGVDVSSITRLGDHVTVMGAFVWLPRREFIEFVDNFGNSLAGNNLTRASEWSASASIDYRMPVSNIGEFSASLDYDYRTAFYFTKENVASQYQEDFGLLNLGLRFESARGGWYVFASARNLLDEDYFTQIFLQSAPGYPTRYEAGFGWRL